MSDLPNVESILGLWYCVDTNLYDDDHEFVPEMEALRAFDRDGWILLTKTDTVDLELAQHGNDEKRAQLLKASSKHVEHFGAATFDHSRLDHSVVGGPDDQARLDRVIETLFPGDDPRDVGARRADARIRDAKHIDTALRYGAQGLITNDRRDLQSRADEIRDRFNGFLIISPAQALAIVDRIKRRHDTRNH
jgi:hypothetical protein